MNKIRYWKKRYYLFSRLYESQEIAGPMFTRLFNLVCELDAYLFDLED